MLTAIVRSASARSPHPLGANRLRRNPLAVGWNRMRYTFEVRVAPRRLESLHQSRLDGFMVQLDLRDQNEKAIYFNGLAEFTVASFFAAAIPRGGTVVDIGANVGQYSLIAARRVGAGGRVVAVEPNPSIRVRLANHIRDNDVSCVTVLERALSDQDQMVTLSVPTDGNHCLSQIEDGLGVTVGRTMVRASRLDTVAGELSLSCVDVIKCDVEGYEDRVLKGGSATIDRWRPAIFFEANGLRGCGHTVTNDAMETLRTMGYLLFAMVREGWKLMPLQVGVDPMLFSEPKVALNLLALHPESKRWAALTTAKIVPPRIDKTPPR